MDPKQFIPRSPKFSILSLFILLAVSCGGGSKTSGPKTLEDGRVFIFYQPTNQAEINSGSFVTASYADPETFETNEVTVQKGEKKEITIRPIKGGTEVTFKVLGHTPRGQPGADVKIAINGNIIIHVTRVYSESSYDNPLIDYDILSG